MSEGAQFTHAHMVRFERLLPGPVEHAWRMLTEVALLPGWYGEGRIEAKAGGAVELKPSGDDTALTLTHLPVLERFVKLNAMGWHTYLDMVAAALRGEPVAPRDAYMSRNAKTYGIDLANPLG